MANLKNLNLKILIPVAAGILIIILAISAYFLLFSATIFINVAPSNATITIDGKSYNNHTTPHLRPGSHSVEVSRSGFTTYSETVTFPANTEYDLSVALSPSSDETKNWYQEHPEDAEIAERYGGLLLDRAVDAFAERYPEATTINHIDNNYRITTNVVDDNLEISIDAVDGSYDSAFSYLTSNNIDILNYKIRFPLLYNVFEEYRSAILALSETSSRSLADKILSLVTDESSRLEILGSSCTSNYCLYKIQHTFTAREESYTNNYYAILQKSGDGWKVIATPDLIITKPAYPDIPEDVLNNINKMEVSIVPFPP